MNDKLQELWTIISDPRRVITGDGIGEEYKSDALLKVKGTVWAVVRAISTDEVSKVLAFAFKYEIPVTPRGAGTNLVGSTVPFGLGIVLDLTAMNRILELDLETFTATVEPGAVLQDFQEYVEQRGLFYPPDPGEKTATIGGNISTNAGGMRAVKYGVTRDYVMGLEIVLADGRVLNVGSKNIKDSSGLSLKNLIIGAEGTLGVITKCILKVIPKPPFSLSVLVPFNSLAAGIENVQKIINQNANPTAIEFVERKVVQFGEDYLKVSFPYPEAAAYIILTFDGHEEEIEANIKRIEETVRPDALAFLRLTNQQTAAEVWKLRGALVKAVDAVSEQEPVDVVVPINKIAEFTAFVNQLSEQTNMQMISFGHAGDGNVHLCILRGNRSQRQWEEELHENMKKIYAKAYELGGLTSGEHGIGLSKQRYYFQGAEKNNIDVMNEIKNVLDRKHILNSHKVYMS